MLARFSWQLRPVPAPSTGRANRYGWLLIGLLTLLFTIWLFYRVVGQPAWPARLPDLIGELLSLLEAAMAFTLTFLWAALWWRHRHPPLSGDVVVHSLDELYALDPSEFERYVGSLFRHKGYRVRLRGRSGDLGVDLVLWSANGRKKAVVQCKRYRSTVGAKVVRELYGTLIHERASHAFLVTTADISEAARTWARLKPITLIDGTTLVEVAASLARNGAQNERN